MQSFCTMDFVQSFPLTIQRTACPILNSLEEGPARVAGVQRKTVNSKIKRGSQ